MLPLCSLITKRQEKSKGWGALIELHPKYKACHYNVEALPPMNFPQLDRAGGPLALIVLRNSVGLELARPKSCMQAGESCRLGWEQDSHCILDPRCLPLPPSCRFTLTTMLTLVLQYIPQSPLLPHSIYLRWMFLLLLLQRCPISQEEFKRKANVISR